MDSLPSKGNSLTINEIFFSLQGESSRAGIPTVFIRLTGCNLRCSYCDTTYAYEEGSPVKTEKIIKEAGSYECENIMITGGEPMMQAGTIRLAERLLENGFFVMMETNGTVDLTPLPPGVVKIVDIKCPSSGCGGSFLEANLQTICSEDEIKFVISSKEDFDWSVKESERLNLLSICTVNISPVAGKVKKEETAEWILKSGKNFRLNLQLHKLLWGDKRGV